MVAKNRESIFNSHRLALRTSHAASKKDLALDFAPKPSSKLNNEHHVYDAQKFHNPQSGDKEIRKQDKRPMAKRYM